MKYSQDSTVSSSSISAHLSGKSIYTGVLTGDIPSLSKLHSVNLTTPVVLKDNLITSYSDHASRKELINLLANMEVTTISTGVSGNRAVLAATVVEVAELEVQKPLKYIEL